MKTQMKILSSLVLLFALIGTPAFAATSADNSAEENAVDQNTLDELNPFAPNIEEQLQMLDEKYEAETGKSPFQIDSLIPTWAETCVREQCPVYLDISKSEQSAYLYVNGVLQGEFLVSSGVSGRDTPDFDRHPDGRIYDRYTSTKFPGGDYDGLGNMPYAVFIKGGFAVHGTGRGNWKKLGTKASHGCIRMHPDNGYRFNRLVRAYGVRSTWIRVR